MKEGALHELPGGWVWTSLEEACKKITDGSHYTPAYVSNGYPFITISDINKDSLDFSSAKLISQEDFEKLRANCNPQAGDVLFSKDGTVGKVIEINFEKEFIVLSSLAIIRPYTDITLPSYLKFLLQSKLVLNQSIKLKTGTALTRIILRNLKTVKIPLSPLPEQRAIVSKIEQLFSDLDNGIENFKKAQAQLKMYRQAVLKTSFEGAFIKGLTEFKDVEVNGIKSKIPKSWQLKKLGEYAKLQGGFAFKSDEYSETGIPIVKISNVHYENIDWTEKSFISSNRLEEFKEYLLFEDDILMAMTRPVIKSLNNVKTVVVKHNDLPALLNQRVGRFMLNNQLDKKYLKYFIYTDFFKFRILSESSSTQQPNISAKKIEDFDFIFPNEANIQHQIVSEIETRLSICDKMEATIAESLQKAESLRQSILKKAFEGKLLNKKELEKARNASDWEPAEKLLEKIRQEKQIKEKNNKPARRS
jgi:type I restriction enzyme S subunit